MVAITTGINPIKNIFDPEVLAQLSDRELHEFAQQYGKISRQSQKQFAAFLPEINKRKLFLKHKFYSIKHYAKVIGGLSEDVVDEILRVHINLKDKPKLQRMIIEQGWSKMRVIASLATHATQDFWAEKVKEMSKPTLEVFVRELKKQGDLPGTQSKMESIQQSLNFEQGCNSELPDSLGSLNITDKNSLPGERSSEEKLNNDQNATRQRSSLAQSGSSGAENIGVRTSISFKIELETEIQLRIFRYKFEKRTKQPQDFNSVLKEFLRLAQIHQNCK